MTLAQVFIIFDPPFLLCVLWMFYCINRTAGDRMRALEAIRGRPFTGMPVLVALDTVTFGSHVWARVRCKDPWKLYDQVVLDAIQNPKHDLEEMRAAVEGRFEPPPAVH